MNIQFFGGRGRGSGNSLRNYYLSKVSNKKAWNTVNEIYRKNAKYGDGARLMLCYMK